MRSLEWIMLHRLPHATCRKFLTKEKKNVLFKCGWGEGFKIISSVMVSRGRTSGIKSLLGKITCPELADVICSYDCMAARVLADFRGRLCLSVRPCGSLSPILRGQDTDDVVQAFSYEVQKKLLAGVSLANMLSTNDGIAVHLTDGCVICVTTSVPQVVMHDATHIAAGHLTFTTIGSHGELCTWPRNKNAVYASGAQRLLCAQLASGVRVKSMGATMHTDMVGIHMSDNSLLVLSPLSDHAYRYYKGVEAVDYCPYDLVFWGVDGWLYLDGKRLTRNAREFTSNEELRIVVTHAGTTLFLNRAGERVEMECINMSVENGLAVVTGVMGFCGNVIVLRLHDGGAVACCPATDSYMVKLLKNLLMGRGLLTMHVASKSGWCALLLVDGSVVSWGPPHVCSEGIGVPEGWLAHEIRDHMSNYIVTVCDSGPSRVPIRYVVASDTHLAALSLGGQVYHWAPPASPGFSRQLREELENRVVHSLHSIGTGFVAFTTLPDGSSPCELLLN